MKTEHQLTDVQIGPHSYDLLLEVDFNATPIRQAVTHGSPDNWAPAEGGEVSINRVKLIEVERSDGDTPLDEDFYRELWAAARKEVAHVAGTDAFHDEMYTLAAEDSAEW